jgi:hypothetical protein
MSFHVAGGHLDFFCGYGTPQMFVHWTNSEVSPMPCSIQLLASMLTYIYVVYFTSKYLYTFIHWFSIRRRQSYVRQLVFIPKIIG